MWSLPNRLTISPDSQVALAQDPYPLDKQQTAEVARWRAHQNDADPILRGLARGEIKLGDPVEPLIRANPHYDVLRYGDYVEMTYRPNMGGTGLTAKDGRLIQAGTSSCMFHDVFFSSTPDMSGIGQFIAILERDRAHKQRYATHAALPAVVGVAGGSFWLWPPRLPE